MITKYQHSVAPSTNVTYDTSPGTDCGRCYLSQCHRHATCVHRRVFSCKGVVTQTCHYTSGHATVACSVCVLHAVHHLLNVWLQLASLLHLQYNVTPTQQLTLDIHLQDGSSKYAAAGGSNMTSLCGCSHGDLVRRSLLRRKCCCNDDSFNRNPNRNGCAASHLCKKPCATNAHPKAHCTTSKTHWQVPMLRPCPQ